MAAAGFETVFAAHKSQITSKEDALICYLHWNMINNGFKFIGVGETILENFKEIKKSELLSAGWNVDRALYVLQYVTQKCEQVYLLKIIVRKNKMMIHLTGSEDNDVGSINILVLDYANEDFSNFDSAFKNLSKLEKLFKSELLKLLKKDASTKKKTQAVNTQTSSEHFVPTYPDDPSDPLRVPSHPFDHRRPFNPVGGADLDPTNPYGGGMFMDPRGMIGPLDPRRGFPDPRIPPHARFDPVGPIGFNPDGTPIRRIPEPDPDHELPPGYNDMFM